MQDVKEFYDVLINRRSNRQYLDKAVEDELLSMVIETGRHAPSGGNSQSGHFLVISNKEMLDEIEVLARDAFAKMEVESGMYRSLATAIMASKAGSFVFHYHAPVLILVANQIDYGNAMADSACAIENMLLMAHALGLGSCYINQIKWLNDEPSVHAFLESCGMKEGEAVFGGLVIGYCENRQDKALARKGNEVTYIL